jgi:hypothetical protein
MTDQPAPSPDVETVREALTPPMMEMLRIRFPAWANDSGGYRYAEFIDRVAGIVAEVVPAALRGAGLPEPSGGEVQWGFAETSEPDAKIRKAESEEHARRGDWPYVFTRTRYPERVTDWQEATP